MLQNANPNRHFETFQTQPTYGQYVMFGNAVFFQSTSGKLYTVGSVDRDPTKFHNIQQLGKIFVVVSH